MAYVAIKIFRRDGEFTDAVGQRFVREARAASALNHNNIVTVHEIVRTETRVAIVMEYVSGKPLRALSAAGLEDETIFSIGRQAALALDAAHSAGIVHRDIKPENIMLRSDGCVKVLDFGLAKGLDTITERTAITVPGSIAGGTFRYMSPEHFRTEPITAKSDIFALGLVLYELSYRKHPFVQETTRGPIEILHAIGTSALSAESFRSRSFAPSFEKLLRAMLANDPAQRPTAAEVAAALTPQGKETLPPRPWFRDGKRVSAAVAMVTLFVWAAALITRHASSASVFTQEARLVEVSGESRATAAAISPDARRLAYANVDGIFLKSLGNAEVVTLQGPPGVLIDRLSWSADQSTIIASGFDDENRESIWAVPSNGRQSQQLKSGVRNGVSSPNADRIAFLGEDFSEVGVMDADGQNSKVLLQAKPGELFNLLFWSYDGRYLVFQRKHLSDPANTHESAARWSLEVFDPEAGRIVSTRPNWRNISIGSATAYSPNEIAFLAEDNAPPLGRQSMYLLRLDAKSGQLGGDAQRLAHELFLRDWLNDDLSFSADGSKAVVLKKQLVGAIFVGDFQQAPLRVSNLRRITHVKAPSFPHAWTPDSREIIFESNREGSTDLFRQQIDKRLPVPLLHRPNKDEYLPQITPDGTQILFAASAREQRPFSLMHVGLHGGSAEEVDIGGAPLDEFRCSTGSRGRCVLRKTIAPNFVYYDLDPIKGVGVELARIKSQATLLGDWDVSPDGQFLALPIYAPQVAKIRIVRLQPGSAVSEERLLDLQGLSRLVHVSYAADGNGWFANIDTTSGRRMYFVSRNGSTQPIREISGWAVPAPDGRRVAFFNRVEDTTISMFSDRR